MVPAKPNSEREDPLISVVLSFYNEEEVIPELVRRLRAVFEKIQCRYELIFVNDASTDRSLELLLEERKRKPDIKIINMSRRFGPPAGVLCGFRATSGDAAIYMDSDLQDPPELLEEMVYEWKKDPSIEVVYTTRRRRFGENPITLWLTNLGYRVLKLTANIQVEINSGDFRLISRRVVNEFIKFREKNPFFRFSVAWIGFKQKQIFYDRLPRQGGASKFPLFCAQRYTQFLELSLIPFSDFPLRLCLFLGFLSSMVSFCYLGIVLLFKLMNLSLPGWTAIMAAVLFLGGMQLCVLGVLGLYIGAIHGEVKGRPNYIISDTIGFEKKVVESISGTPSLQTRSVFLSP